MLSELNSGRVLAAFVPAMVWGWGTTSGQGALRTRWALTEIGDSSQYPALLEVVPTVSDRLAAGAKSARNDGPHEAFILMNIERAIKHRGRSYFTKWPYFTSWRSGAIHTGAGEFKWKRKYSSWRLAGGNCGWQLRR